MKPLLLVTLLASGQEPPGRDLSAVATFESVGLYWKAPGGAEDKPCAVRYRPAGKPDWKEGYPLWFDARNSEYRGSLVHLQPGTEYEISLALPGTSTKASLKARTWSESFPLIERVPLPPQSGETLVIRQSGTPAGYRLYGPPPGAATATIDAAGQQDFCVKVEASYVILHGLTLKNARIHAIQLVGEVHDVVIEECDISGWGRVAEDGWGVDYDAAVYSKHAGVKRIVVQRNRIHHPRSNSNNWRQERPRKGKRESSHPEGPQAVCLWDSEGNHVIRFNAISSDEEHHYNDVLGAGSNFSVRGFPHRDSDIYGNLLSHCWDDAIESEGGNANVRIWGNYLTDCFVGVAVASTSTGPLFIWRNVMGRSRLSPKEKGGGFLKTSDRTGGGRIHVFHNTILQPAEGGATVGLGWGGPMANVVSRNNILHVRRTAAVRKGEVGLDFDFDLCSADPPEGHEKHGIRGVPSYAVPPSIVSGKGSFGLAPQSPGFDAGVRLPGFNDGFQGQAPDVGAHEAGSPPMEFGPDAVRRKDPGR